MCPAAFHRRSKSFRLALMTGFCALAVGQVSTQAYDTWSKVESAEETREYTQQLREGTFEDPQKGMVERIILPQLALPANRSNIVTVRQRIRDILTRGTTAPRVFDAVNDVTADFMAKLAADEGQDIAVRINAIILIGELVAADRKAWPGSVKHLATAAADAKLPLAVRIAAMAGLVRQVNDGRASADFAKIVAPVVTSIITTPPEGTPSGVAWMIGRGLDMVPVVGGSPAVMKAVADILADEQADLDLRIRAAVALGRLVKPGASTDLASAVKQIRSVATMALARDIAEAEARRFASQLRGGVGTPVDAMPGGTPPPPLPPAGGQPGGGGLFDGGLFGGAGGVDGQFAMPMVLDPDAIPTLACRRNAWRLASLADALQPEPTKDSGIARVLTGDAAAEALEVATLLRAQGRAIESAPDERTVKASLTAIEALAQPAPTGEPGASPAIPAAPATPSAPPVDAPFGGAGETSPF